ncbi:MAG TPA: hypothetical protein VIT85_01800 [Solirubrobacterales bacterium]
MGPIAIAMACLAIGCPGSPEESLPPPQPFAIHFEKSGGLKPIPIELTIRPGRRAMASISGTRAGERTVRFRVSRRKVASLKSGLRRAHFFKLQSPFPGNCADCFLYSIEYREHKVSTDQSAMPAKLGEVVAELESLVYAHAIPPNA